MVAEQLQPIQYDWAFVEVGDFYLRSCMQHELYGEVGGEQEHIFEAGVRFFDDLQNDELLLLYVPLVHGDFAECVLAL